jgi:glycosyltransferase involved in cell wall biosynthesis
MKILMAANPNSTHTRRWVQALYAQGIEIVLFSLTHFDTDYYKQFDGVRWYCMKDASDLAKRESRFRKLSYFRAIGKLKKILKIEAPDILHAHYASSYGFVAARCGYHPLIVSVWGSDVFEFPRSSVIARKMLRYSLRKADVVLSTSHNMAAETQKYTTKNIQVTPFGIDTSVFTNAGKRLHFKQEDVVIGSIKTLEPVYGHEKLLHAFARLHNMKQTHAIKLLLVGDGSLKASLEALAVTLGISEHVVFTGFVEHEQILDYFSSIDIFVISSFQESFGVVALEAASCELPVVASRVGGLPEVVDEGVTALLVEPGNIQELTDALHKLVNDLQLRRSMGLAGRAFVKEHYEWNRCVETMLTVYKDVTKM